MGRDVRYHGEYVRTLCALPPIVTGIGGEAFNPIRRIRDIGALPFLFS
eukprot:SAG11_NODE_29810_length_307_cov_0.600962_1_plen_47_part_01